MNYKLIYDLIIEKALSTIRVVGKGIYFESHHIVPVCLGGSDDSLNKVLLTAREHFVCHKLLVEIYPDNKKLFYALWMMSTTRINNIDYFISSNEYERMKIRLSKIQSEKFSGSGNPMFGSKRSGKNNPHFGKRHSEKFKTDMSLFMKERIKQEGIIGICKTNPKFWQGKVGKDAPAFGHIHDEETRLKISNGLKGKYVGDKSSQFGKRYSRSEETKRKMSESAKNRYKVKEL